jgi:hypothetical protein
MPKFVAYESEDETNSHQIEKSAPPPADDSGHCQSAKDEEEEQEKRIKIQNQALDSYAEFKLLWDDGESHPAIIRSLGRVECFRGWQLFHSDPANFECWLLATKYPLPTSIPPPLRLSVSMTRRWDNEARRRQKYWTVLS